TRPWPRAAPATPLPLHPPPDDPPATGRASTPGVCRGGPTRLASRPPETIANTAGALRILIFDPFAGISGAMILGGRGDRGRDPGWLRDFVGSLGLGPVGVEVARVQRRGIACAHVRFDLPHEHAHRHLSDILEIVDRAAAPESVRQRAAAVFRRLAEAE